MPGGASGISALTEMRALMTQDQYGRIPAIMAIFGDLIPEFGREIPYSANFRGLSTIRRRFVSTGIVVAIDHAIPERTLRRGLSKWVDEGRLVSTGRRRSTRYRLSEARVEPEFRPCGA